MEISVFLANDDKVWMYQNPKNYFDGMKFRHYWTYMLRTLCTVCPINVRGDLVASCHSAFDHQKDCVSCSSIQHIPKKKETIKQRWFRNIILLFGLNKGLNKVYKSDTVKVK